jgi:hypothetical protein
MNPSIGFGGRQGLDQADLAKYRSYVPDVNDVIWQPLYDYQLYPAAGALNFNFFATPQGQGATSAFGAAAGVKTIQDTNMQLAGQLGAGNQFLVMGIEVELWTSNLPGLFAAIAPTAAQQARNWDDVYSILRNGVLTLNIQNRIYAQDAPLMKFPTQTGLDGVAESSGTVAAVYVQTEYAVGNGLAYNIVPVLIKENQAFGVNINFAAAIASVSTSDLRIGVRLNGKMIRNAQ